jgi:hypothetical protein
MGRRIKLAALLALGAPKKTAPNWEGRVYKKDDMRDFFRLCLMLDYLISGKLGKKTKGPAVSFARPYGNASQKQNCMVKGRYGMEKEKHLRFLKEYLPQENKKDVEEKPELFSGEPVDEEFLEAYQEKAAGWEKCPP